MHDRRQARLPHDGGFQRTASRARDENARNRAWARKRRRSSGFRYTAPTCTSDQTARLFASFSFFFFQTKKKDIVPPLYVREERVAPFADGRKIKIFIVCIYGPSGRRSLYKVRAFAADGAAARSAIAAESRVRWADGTASLQFPFVFSKRESFCKLFGKSQPPLLQERGLLCIIF